MPTRGQPPARQIAHRLIDSHRRERDAGESSARAAAIASENLYRELARWVGPDGCHALFIRALAQARAEHPALKQIQLRTHGEPYLDGLPEAIMANGDVTTAEALESMLVTLAELLGRLIGDDMAVNLIERSLPASDRGDSTADNKQEEA